MKDNHQLITEHVEAAKRVARKVARFVDDRELRADVESAAMVGLTEAAERYDASGGEPFFAFAVKRVRGAALDELRRADRLPRRERTRVKHVAAARASVEARTGGAANDNAVAAEAGISLDELESTQARTSAFAHVRYDECHEHTAAAAEPSPADLLEHSQKIAAITDALPRLPERDREVLALYYGREMNLREIGATLGVTESRVCQLRSRAASALRREIFSRTTAPANDRGGRARRASAMSW